MDHCGLTPRLRLKASALRSYPHPFERVTSKLRLLSPEPSRVRLVNSKTASLRKLPVDRQPQRTDSHWFETGSCKRPLTPHPQMSARHVEDLRYNGPLTHRLRSTAADRCVNATLKLSQSRRWLFLTFIDLASKILINPKKPVSTPMKA